MDQADVYRTGYLPGFGEIFVLLCEGHDVYEHQDFVEVNLFVVRKGEWQTDSWVVKASQSVIDTVNARTHADWDLYSQSREAAQAKARQSYVEWLDDEEYPLSWAADVKLQRCEATDFIGLRIRGELARDALKKAARNTECDELAGWLRGIADLPEFTISRRSSD